MPGSCQGAGSRHGTVSLHCGDGGAGRREASIVIQHTLSSAWMQPNKSSNSKLHTAEGSTEHNTKTSLAPGYWQCPHSQPSQPLKSNPSCQHTDRSSLSYPHCRINSGVQVHNPPASQILRSSSVKPRWFSYFSCWLRWLCEHWRLRLCSKPRELGTFCSECQRH